MQAVRVLLIEDDPDCAQLYRLGLGARGFPVTWAPDGETGLSIARAGSIDLIVTDIHMPGKNGVEVLRDLRGRPPARELPVVVLSNESDPELWRQTRELGALDWMVKGSATPTTLSKWIERWAAEQGAEEVSSPGSE